MCLKLDVRLNLPPVMRHPNLLLCQPTDFSFIAKQLCFLMLSLSQEILLLLFPYFYFNGYYYI